jgi:hypothetical protein
MFRPGRLSRNARLILHKLYSKRPSTTPPHPTKSSRMPNGIMYSSDVTLTSLLPSPSLSHTSRTFHGAPIPMTSRQTPNNSQAHNSLITSSSPAHTADGPPLLALSLYLQFTQFSLSPHTPGALPTARQYSTFEDCCGHKLKLGN